MRIIAIIQVHLITYAKVSGKYDIIDGSRWNEQTAGKAGWQEI